MTEPNTIQHFSRSLSRMQGLSGGQPFWSPQSSVAHTSEGWDLFRTGCEWSTKLNNSFSWHKTTKINLTLLGSELARHWHGDRGRGPCSTWAENQHPITTFQTLYNLDLRGSRTRTLLFSLTWFLLWKACRKGLGNVPEYIILPLLSAYFFH